jgi:hypothetical protein
VRELVALVRLHDVTERMMIQRPGCVRALSPMDEISDPEAAPHPARQGWPD